MVALPSTAESTLAECSRILSDQGLSGYKGLLRLSPVVVLVVNRK